MATRSVQARMRHVTAAVVAALALTGACSGGDSPQAQPVTTTTAPTDDTAGSAPAPSAEEAVDRLLAAERDGDHAASYRLLSAQGRRGLDPNAWTRRRNDLPRITGFRVEPGQGATVVALVDHEPGLDPFVGLSPARERQSFRARQGAGGWLVDPDPVVEPQYPDAAAARAAALAWAEAVQACDQPRARGLQGVEAPFGPVEALAGLCWTRDPLSAGPP
ncbi:MAG: hypothetical protein ACRDZW_05125, partial [Acidimicrobiales bacterium]